MAKKRKRRRALRWLWLLPLVLLLPLLVYGGFYVKEQMELAQIPPLEREALSFLQLPEQQREPETGLGQAFCRAVRDSWRWDSVGEASYSGSSRDRSAEQRLTVYRLNPDRLTEGLAEAVQEQLTAQALAARRSDEVYGEDGRFLPQLGRAAFEQALAARLEQAGQCVEAHEALVHFDWTQNGWRLR